MRPRQNQFRVERLEDRCTPAIDILFAGGKVTEFRPAGTDAGMFAVFEIGEPHTYTFALADGGADNASFQLVGNKLFTTGPFDFTGKVTYSIRVRATDELGESAEQDFVVSVQDNPHVARDGRTFHVAGTLNDDDFTFAAGEALHGILLNGEHLAVPTAAVDRVLFHGGGGTNTAALYGRGDGNTAALDSTYGVLRGTGFEVWTADTVRISAVAGGKGGAAYFAGTAGDDTFAGTAEYSSLAGDGYANYAGGFLQVAAYSEASLNGGADAAYLSGTEGDDYFVGGNYTSYMYLNTEGDDGLVGQPPFIAVNGFRSITAFSHGGNDVAYLSGSSILLGAPSGGIFVGTPTYASFDGGSFSNTAVGFSRVNAFAVGRGNVFYMVDSPGDDVLSLRALANSSSSIATLTGTAFSIEASLTTPSNVVVYATQGNDAAYIDDSPIDDTFGAGGSAAQLSNASYTVRVEGFDGVVAHAFNGGTNRKVIGPVDYFLETPGDWI